MATAGRVSLIGIFENVSAARFPVVQSIAGKSFTVVQVPTQALAS